MEESGKDVPEPQPVHSFTVPYDVLSKTPLEKMQLVDFTGINHYEIPLYLQYMAVGTIVLHQIYSQQF